MTASCAHIAAGPNKFDVLCDGTRCRHNARSRRRNLNRKACCERAVAARAGRAQHCGISRRHQLLPWLSFFILTDVQIESSPASPSLKHASLQLWRGNARRSRNGTHIRCNPFPRVRSGGRISRKSISRQWCAGRSSTAWKPYAGHPDAQARRPKMRDREVVDPFTCLGDGRCRSGEPCDAPPRRCVARRVRRR